MKNTQTCVVGEARSDLYLVKGCGKRHHVGETEYIPVLMNVCCFSFIIWCIYAAH